MTPVRNVEAHIRLVINRKHTSDKQHDKLNETTTSIVLACMINNEIRNVHKKKNFQ